MDFPRTDDMNPLMLAVNNGDIETIKKLMDIKYSIFYVNKYGKSAFDIAINKGYRDIYYMLLKYAQEYEVKTDAEIKNSTAIMQRVANVLKYKKDW